MGKGEADSGSRTRIGHLNNIYHLANSIFAKEARPYSVAMAVSDTSETTIKDLCSVGLPMQASASSIRLLTIEQ